MLNRIRYVKTEKPVVLRSSKSFQHPTNNLARFIVLLNTETNEFKIDDELSGEMIKFGSASSLNMLKKNAKKALVDLGVEGFEKEERKKRS
jgi:hypothetical protein